MHSKQNIHIDCTAVNELFAKNWKMALVTPLISAVAIEDKVLPLPKKITDNIFIFTSIYFLN